jgi:hypothetical protein
MNYSVEMCSGDVVYIPGFLKTGSGIQKLMGKHIQTHREQCDFF